MEREKEGETIFGDLFRKEVRFDRFRIKVWQLFRKIDQILTNIREKIWNISKQKNYKEGWDKARY